MRKTPYKTWLLAGLILLMPWVADAAGLGKLTIRSALGQPLLAEVDLVSVQTGELATLVARLAPPEAFTQANIAYSPALVGVRMSIERRADGQPYIRIISTRPVNEPFLDLLVELSWPQGRLVREYTALVDPIGYTPAVPVAPVEPVAPPVVITPPVTPEPQPIALPPQPPVAAAVPLEARPAVAPARPAKPPVAPAAQSATKAYGPVRRGETLARIASKVKPEGVTLEQMLVSLYHANPDAFAGNMNHLKTGRILRVPERELVIATGQSEAVKEVRVESANWNAYRQKLAEAAGESPARETKPAASGKITTKVDDKSGKVAPKEVLKLSKGEPAAGKAGDGKGARGSVTSRMRMLEEEAIAREKALVDANNRIAQLEKTNKDMQRVLEIKAQPPVAKPAPPPPPAPEPDLIEQIMSEPLYLVAGGGMLVLIGVGGYLFVRRRRSQAGGDEPVGKPSEPVISMTTDAAGGTGVLVLLGGYWSALSARLRRAKAGDGGAARERIAPELMATAAGSAAASAESAAKPVTRMPMAGGTEEVDPIAEADMYLNFGRDVQAEEVLIEALAKNPGHEEAQLKLLQVYAGRKDKAAFEKLARTLHARTKGAGDTWIKAAAMGFAVDPRNALYEAGKSAPAAAPPIVGGIGPDLDFNFDIDAEPAAGVAEIDFANASVAEAEKAESLPVPPGEIADAVVTRPPAGPDVTLEAPARATVATSDNGEPAAPMSDMIDFSFDTLAPVRAPVESADAEKSAAETATGMPAFEPEFKLDFGGSETAVPPAPELNFGDIKLDFEEGPAAEISKAESGARDNHWYDVQTKFDLAKAYQEMGEKGGAREILQEVLKEGDAGQRAEAQKLLASLS